MVSTGLAARFVVSTGSTTRFVVSTGLGARFVVSTGSTTRFVVSTTRLRDHHALRRLRVVFRRTRWPVGGYRAGARARPVRRPTILWMTPGGGLDGLDHPAPWSRRARPPGSVVSTGS